MFMHKNINTLKYATNERKRGFSELETRELAQPFGHVAMESARVSRDHDLSIDPRHAETDFFAVHGGESLRHDTAIGLGEYALLRDRLIAPERHLMPKTETGAATWSRKLDANGNFAGDDNFVTGHNFAAVADGVGSSLNGGLASKAVSELLANELPGVNELTSKKDVKKRVKQILRDAHQVVLNEQGTTDLSMASTATTLNYVVIDDETYAVIGNVGDSPAYLTRDGKISEVTDWHRKVMPKPTKRVALGKPLEFDPVVKFIKVEPGDIISLTSNGVRKRDIDGSKLSKIAARHHNPQKIARLLAELQGPSKDDCTAIVSRYEGTLDPARGRSLDDELIAA